MTEEPTTTRNAVDEVRRTSLLAAVLWVVAGVAFIAATVLVARWMGQPREPELRGLGEVAPGHDLSIERIRATIVKLASVPSRVTGYGGDEEARKFVLAELKNIGVAGDDVQVQKFTVPVPIVESATLTHTRAGEKTSLDLHPLWPNLARTCQTSAEGIIGPLVDVGRCTDEELAGKTLTGSILVADWDCDTEWLSAPEFGGKAVIFRATERGTGYTARNKLLTVPANVPRFYVTEKDLPALKAMMAAPASPATVHCRMAWRSVASANVLARIRQPADWSPGDVSDEPVIFHAYYDSISVVPQLSPGAEQACGVATALELARFYRNQPEAPSRPVYLLLTGAHGQALAGMTHFVDTLRNGLLRGWSGNQARTLLGRMGRPGLMVGLDLSSRSDRMGLFCMGHFRPHGEGQLRPTFSVLGLKLRDLAKEACPQAAEGALGSFVDCINLTQGRPWHSYFPYLSPFESELPVVGGIPAVTFATINDSRRRVDTPHDTADRLRMDLLARQIRSEPKRRIGLARLAMALTSWQGPFVSKSLADRWAYVAGRVAWLDQQRDYTPSEPLAGATVFLKAKQGEKFLVGTRGHSAAISGRDGSFRLAGISRPLTHWEVREYLLEAYGSATETFLRDNPRATREYLGVLARAGRPAEAIRPDGSIIFAVDMARPGEYPWRIRVTKEDQNLNLVTFPCKAISLFGLTDPREYIPLSDLQILEASTQSPPFQFGQSVTELTTGRDENNCLTLWADPTIRVRLTFGFGYQKRRLILINNTDPEGDPEGEGFVLEDLETIPSMMLQGATDMWNLNQWRLDSLRRHGINNPRVLRIHEEAKEYLDQARKALADKDYGTYRQASEKGWALESKAYLELLDTTNNMIKGVLFYLAVLIPFAYCLERLILAGNTIRKRILGMAGIFAGSFLILVFVHPAFRFTLTPTIVLLAFVILALAAAVSVLLVGKFDRMLKARKQEVTGLQEDARNVAGIAVHAVDLGIANIRRRPRRGFLTAMTIVLVTFTLLSFTSLVPELNISKLPHMRGEAGAYKGLMVRSRSWATLPKPLYDSLERTFADAGQSPSKVAGRAWLYSDPSGMNSQIDLAVPHTPASAPTTRPAAAAAAPAEATGHFTAKALLCMEPTEPAVTGIDKTLVAGRWFRRRDELGIILPTHVATLLGLGPGDLGKPVLLFGKELPLLGLLDAEKLTNMRDVDGERLTPVDFVQQQEMQAQRATAGEEAADTFEEYVHYHGDQIGIIPLAYGRLLGATFRSVAIKTAADLSPDEEAERFARRSNSTILASDGQDDVTLYASVDTARLSVAGQIVVPVILGFMMVLGTMLGSVYERKKEIFVYNSVGLSPVNVSSLFLAESSVYAILGGAMGFLLGQIISKILLMTGMLSGLTLNYSAGSTVFVTVLTMLIVLLSTLYPARQAFLAAVPDTHRESQFGDAEAHASRVSLWMPFVATPTSVLGMQTYMHRYLQSIEGVTVGDLAVDNLRVRLEHIDGHDQPVLTFRAWMAPFDLGVSHDVELRLAWRADRGVYQYHLIAERYSGDQQNWRRLMPRFLMTIRKQLLMWRILSADAIDEYNRRGEALFGRRPQEGEANA